jgi:isopenicillin-N N-acyltransferase like protein
MFNIIDTLHAESAKEQGFLYGQLCSTQILHSRETYSRLFASCGISWQQACDKARAMQDAISALDPSFLDEIHGIAEGAGVRYEDILALNCRTEILPAEFLGVAATPIDNNFSQKSGSPPLTSAQKEAAAVFGEGECTALALTPGASGDGQTWLAQNWDWIGTQRQAVVLLKGRSWSHTNSAAKNTLETNPHQTGVVTPGREFMTLTEAGMLAKIGLGVGPETNRVAIGLNIVRSQHDGEKPAIPVHALLRHLLTQPSLKAIRARMNDLAQSFGFGAGSNVPCADTAGEVASLEVSPRGWQEWPAEDGVMTHTNHFLSEPLKPIQQPTSGLLSSEPRLATAKRHALNKPMRQADLEALLRDETNGYLAVCRHPNPELAPDARVESVAGVMINVTARSMWIAPDVPSKVAFERVI